MNIKYCLEITDYKGEKVVFLEETRLIKSKKHPELRGNEGIEFVNGRVKETIQKPDFIYEDYNYPKKRQCQYIKEFKCNNEYRYTKVVIRRIGRPLYVVTAFRPNNVKERDKTKLLFGEDNYEN